MKLSETKNCYEVDVYLDELEDDTRVILFKLQDQEVGFDAEQAALVIQVLQHFIATGELPE